jgi:hypothetical protein
MLHLFEGMLLPKVEGFFMKSLLGSTIVRLGTLFVMLGVPHVALAQAPAAPTAQPAPAQPAPTQAPAPWGSSAGQAPPPPAGQPAQQAPGYAPPPGYKLVPVQEQPQQQPQPQPQYQQPSTPPELPYSEGQAVPPGYRVVERSRRGLIIAGLVTTGVAWSFSVTAAVTADYEDNSGFLLIPVLGPWLMLATGGADDPPCTNDADIEFCESNAGLRGVLVLDGLVQTAGAVMFVLGVANPSKRLVRDDVSFRVVPMTIGKTGNGLGVVGTF